MSSGRVESSSLKAASGKIWRVDYRLQSNSPCINWGRILVVSNAFGLDESDSDTLPDDWERALGGNQDPSAISSNGVNTILESYINGLDPTDPSRTFSTSMTRPSPNTVLGWNATSGRVYSVSYSTNLLSGFLPLQTNLPWSSGGFTDDVHSVEEQLYDKVDVRFFDGDIDDNDVEGTGT